MCFTNLPVEFDEDGNPYLEEAAAEIDHPTHRDHTHDYDEETVGCVEGDPGPALADTDPDEAYDAILETLPEEARDRVTKSDRTTATTNTQTVPDHQ